MSKGFEVTPNARPERAYLVGVSLPSGSIALANEHLEELGHLAQTAGAEVVGRTVQGRTRIDGATYIGPGKAKQVEEACRDAGASLLIFDNDLSPAQARNLEKIVGINVIDRTELILDIFARRAKTQQAKIQVELAQLEYALPRLTRLWNHLSRQAGGIGLRGPGETQLEVDRRHIHERMGHLRRLLKKIARRRDTIRRGRNGLPVAALIGYTNAGKSTLMRRLTGADVYIENQLFATLDTMTRKMKSKNTSILLIDTVGFIRKLPRHLATSFKATLEDTARADLYLHVVDASHATFKDQMEVTDSAVREIGGPSVETIHVFNKTDRLSVEQIDALRGKYPEAMFVSAVAGDGIELLVDAVEGFFLGQNLRVEVKIPAGDGKNISRIRDLLHNVIDSFQGDLCVLNGTIESNQMGRLESVTGAQIRYLF